MASLAATSILSSHARSPPEAFPRHSGLFLHRVPSLKEGCHLKEKRHTWYTSAAARHSLWRQIPLQILGRCILLPSTIYPRSGKRRVLSLSPLPTPPIWAPATSNRQPPSSPPGLSLRCPLQKQNSDAQMKRARLLDRGCRETRMASYMKVRAQNALQGTPRF